jgi:glucosyl-3-phosphoglycerate synthase
LTQSFTIRHQRFSAGQVVLARMIGCHPNLCLANSIETTPHTPHSASPDEGNNASALAEQGGRLMVTRSVGTFDATGWTAERVAALKGQRTVTLCFPCRDEAATIGELVTSARRHLLEVVGLVDELIVLDDRSTDETSAVAEAAGAHVVDIDDVHGTHSVGHGKGNALWASLVASHGDFIVWCDGDVTSFTPDWVVRLLAPLVVDDTINLVKASYLRPTNTGGGGRTTELVARPLLSMFAPGLSALSQPLSGEFAGRRTALETIPMMEGWGVEIAMLFDVARAFGVETITRSTLVSAATATEAWKPCLCRPPK